MFSIGDFATFTQVSVTALRLWDRRGLLPPARVDERTGYRYYSATQVGTVHRIEAYKALGFTLAQIHDLLRDPPTPEALAGMLALRRAEAEAALRLSQERIAAIETKLRHLERSEAMNVAYEITRTTAPATRLAAVSHRVAATDDDPDRLPTVFGDLFARLGGALAAAEVRPNGPAWCLYDSADDAGLVVHAALPIDGAVTPPAGVELIERRQADVASTVHLGSMETIAQAYTALMEWIEESGLGPVGGAAEIALTWDPDDPEANVTLVQIPVTEVD